MERGERGRAVQGPSSAEVWVRLIGILVMLALYERRALILADSGTNAQVAPEEWQTIVDALTLGLRSGRAAEAMVEAIDACGRLLETRRVERRADDVDEIPNVLRVRDR